MTQITGFASDGAANVSGSRNSLGSRIEVEIPNLFRIKCVCHSAHLIALKAAATHPASVDVFVHRVVFYFSHSPKRSRELEPFLRALSAHTHRIPKPIRTRWLTHQSTVSTILTHWQALLEYFRVQPFSGPTAIELKCSMERPHLKAYLLFLVSNLKLLESFNCIFQSEALLIHKLHSHIRTIHLTFAEFVLDATYIDQNRDAFFLIDASLSNYRLSTDSIFIAPALDAHIRTIPAEAHQTLRQHFKNFYIVCCTQIRSRFVNESFFYEKLAYLDPKNVLRTNGRVDISPLVEKSSYVLDNAQDMDDICSQWRLLKNDSELKEFENSSLENFWQKVTENQTLDYSKLGKFSLTLLTLPISTAEVERIFSSVTFI